MKPTIYIETSVISMLTARPSRDLIIAAHQQITSAWWDTIIPLCDPYISPVVLEEVAKGDVSAAGKRIDAIRDFSVLSMLPNISELAQEYFQTINLPEKARADSYHLAISTCHGMDYLVSWNCTHIASGRVRAIVDGINVSYGYRSPVICTPEELMEV